MECGKIPKTQVTGSSKNKTDFRIVGGNSIAITQAPFQGQIIYRGGLICGCALLGPERAITAAHCKISNSPGDFTLRFGTSYNNNGGSAFKVTDFMRYPYYNSNTNDYDVALLKFSPKLTAYTTSISPIQIFPENTIYNAGYLVWVSGWGYLQASSNQESYNLMQVQVPIVSNSQCNTWYGGGITSRMICAGYQNGGKDSCQGDRSL